jgi:hypothetical protein
MTDKLSREIEILIKNLESLNVPVLELLNAPVREKELIKFLNEYFVGIPISKDIKGIFLWHNGTATDHIRPAEIFYLFPGFFLNSIEKIQNIMDAIESVYFVKEKGFLPLFSSGRGEYLALNLNEFSNEPDSTPIYYLSTWNPSLDVYTTMYDSLYQMFDTINECFKQEVYFMNSNNSWLDYDIKRRNRISRKMNPNSDYWK